MNPCDELLAWLHGQIDPHDQNNPKYADLWKAIAATRKAKSNILAAKPVDPIYVSVEDWQRFHSDTEVKQ